MSDLNALSATCHAANIKWWQNPETGARIERNKGELLCLIHSEISEAMEGERKNAVQMVAQTRFSPKQLHGQGQADQLQMLAGVGIDFESFPSAFKDGTFVRRETRERLLTPDELARIPVAHRPSGPVLRSSVEVLDLPPFKDVPDRVAVIFPPLPSPPEGR